MKMNNRAVGLHSYSGIAHIRVYKNIVIYTGM